MEQEKKAQTSGKDNKMREIRIEKVTLNIGAGKEQSRLDKGIKLIKNITGIDPVKTVTKKRIPTWGLRPGLPIGCKLTLRGEKANEILTRFLGAKDNILEESNFDNNGNVCFGIEEYIDIPGVKYDPEIGIIGLQICITLERPGFSIKRKKIKRKVGAKHKITKQNSIDYFKKKFNVKFEE